MEYYKNLDLESINYFDDEGISKTEDWRDIQNYIGGYQISDLGRVKALQKRIFNDRNNAFSIYQPRIMKSSIEGGGYLSLTLSRDAKRKSHKIHKLVAEAFLGHVPCGYKEIVDHKNNIRKDNRLVNLQRTTSRHNNSKDTNGKSSYTGVCWDKQLNKWRSQITINKTHIFLGLYSLESEAGRAYEIAMNNIDKFTGDTKAFRKFIRLHH